MFYKNKSILKSALILMMNNTDSLSLMSAIYKAFDNVKLDDIVDVETKNLVSIIKILSSDIQNKGIKSPNSAKLYIENSSIPDETKELVSSLGHRQSESVVADYKNFFTKMLYVNTMEQLVDKLNGDFDKFKKAGVEQVKNRLESLIDTQHSFDDVMLEVSRSVDESDLFVVDISQDGSKNIGLDKVEQSLITQDHNKIKTGMWIDNLTGGGFLNKALYLVAATAGGFKSGFLQNVAEFVSMAMKPEDFLIPDGMTPAVYYLNLEMTSTQMLERKMAFYGESFDDMTARMSLDGTSLGEELERVLVKNNSRIPVLYEQGDAEVYTIHDVKLKLKNAERAGYYIVAVILDYADLLKYDASNLALDVAARKEVVVAKIESLRALAKEFDVPVISGAQLNRGAEEALKSKENRAATDDIILDVSSAQLAKGYAIKTIPEQIYVCLKQTVNDKDYFVIVVDKDRQGKAVYVPSELDKKEGKDKVHKGKRKRHTGRVMYVAEMDGFRISDRYSNTIQTFTDDESIFDIMDVDSVEVE